MNNVLADILRYYGVKDSACAAELAPGSKTDLHEQLERALRPTGIQYRDVALEGAWYKDATGAYLGLLDDGTLIALVPNKRGGYSYADPESGRRVHVTSANAKRIKREAVCFYRPFPQHSMTLRDLGQFVFRSLDMSDYALAAVATIAVTLIGLLPAWVNQLLFSEVIPSGEELLLAPIGILLFGVMFSQALISMTRSLIMARIGLKLSIQMESAAMGRLLSLPPAFFRSYSAGELAERASAISALGQTLVSIVLTTGLTSVFSLVYIAQIVKYAPALVIPALAVVLADFVVTVIATIANLRYDREQLTRNATLSGVTTALLGGIQKVKLAGAERRGFVRWSKSYARYASMVYGRPLLLRTASVWTTAISLTGTILIYFFAGSSGVTVADYMAFNVAFGMVAGAMSALASIANQIAGIQPTLQLLEPITKAEPEVLQDAEPVESITGAVKLENVSFAYAGSAPPVFTDLSLNVEAGEYVAIVGKTGCGKSTLMRLLLGFEKPASGVVSFDGRDISQLDLRSLRRNIGVVMQDGKLVLGDIFTNITIAAPWLSMDDAWKAAELAGIADDIRALPMGMKTVISDGTGSISGGQRQRLLIARAVAPSPKLLMLDEATSALDNITQRQVSDALAGLGCTRIVIAHRLSTIQACDRIIVLDEGRIAEDGTYNELLAKGGVFAELVKRQRLEEE